MQDSPHEFYWFDVYDHEQSFNNNYQIKKLEFPLRKLPYFLNDQIMPYYMGWLYESVGYFMQSTTTEYWDEVIDIIKPDAVHSFEMLSSSCLLTETMEKQPNLPWIYSCWGSDMYYYMGLPSAFSAELDQMRRLLQRIQYLHTDCQRDYELALILGFRGQHAGVIPGGGGYMLTKYTDKKLKIDDRKIILVKGYENSVGKALNVIKALENIQTKIAGYQVIVFASNPAVSDYIYEKNLPFFSYVGFSLDNTMILQLMGQSLLYIGNSTSDGMPNTLLEAIFMGAFPIQSNPGNVTTEIIENGKNGLLIQDPDNIEALQLLIEDAITNRERLQTAYEMNTKIAVERLAYHINQQKIIEVYNMLKPVS
jgi:glycosyltransferase involved in cell wall biosynthesis